jgi:hypothetical protein
MPEPPVMLTFGYGDTRPRVPSAFWADNGKHPKKFVRWFVLCMAHPYGDPAAPHVLYDVFGVGERGQPIGPLYRVRGRYKRDWWEANAPR